MKGTDFARWLQLPAVERRRLGTAIILLPAVALLVRLIGVRRTDSLLRAMAPARGPTVEADFVVAERLAGLVCLAGRRGPLRVTCLPQALLLDAWLRRMGMRPELRMGVRKLSGELDAHAWVELEGQAIGQAEMLHQPFQAGFQAAIQR